MKISRYVTIMVLLVSIYLLGEYCIKDTDLSTTVTTALTIIAGVAFWMEYKNNERINEAQLIMELNNQFVSNPQFSFVELELEKYYAKYCEAERLGMNMDFSFGIDLDKFDQNRQSLVNYLVHLEGIASLVNEKVLHLNVITDLMAYRYFIAVNNPEVQEKELIPYRDYYHGCFAIYDNWSKALGSDKVPMAEHALGKYLN